MQGSVVVADAGLWPGKGAARRVEGEKLRMGRPTEAAAVAWLETYDHPTSWTPVPPKVERRRGGGQGWGGST